MTADHLTGIEQFEAKLWKAADNLRANSNLASNEYFMPILGLIFLRHATNRYYEAMAAIEEDKAAGRMPDRPLSESDFTRRRALMLPQAALYDVLLKMPKDGNLGAAVTAAMEAVEDRFPPLAGQLPKDYERFENDVLEEMMRTFDSEELRTASGDVFGRIYEYFLAEFSKLGAHDNGEFFTPPSIVQTIVNVIEPDHGVVLDPACGSGGMFVQSSHFIEDEGEDTMKRVTFYGHEKNETTAKLSQINLAVHGLEGSIRAGNEAITYYQDPHELAGQCDFVMANPPFNVDEVDAGKVRGDKPMKAHSLMQAIARANRVYPGKDFGLIVDYNGMLKSLREALAQYALGDDGDSGGGEEIVAPIEERVQALIEAIEATEAHLRGLGFDPAALMGSTGFTRIKGLKDAVEAVYSSDEAKRRFETLARQVFIRFKALLMEPTAHAYAERHDNIEAIYKKLTERRDTADVTSLLKELHRIVNEAIRTQAPGDDQAEGLTFDLSRIDMEKLRAEFAKKVRRKATALQDICEVVEQKLCEMLAQNPSRMDYLQKYEEIVAEYNREKDRVTIEETFGKLMELMEELDAEQKRAVEEGLDEDKLALFDLLKKDHLAKTERERVKQESRKLLASIKARLAKIDRFWEKEKTKAEVEVFILDEVYANLPTPPFTAEEKQAAAAEVYAHVWQQAVRGEFARAA